VTVTFTSLIWPNVTPVVRPSFLTGRFTVPSTGVLAGVYPDNVELPSMAVDDKAIAASMSLLPPLKLISLNAASVPILSAGSVPPS
jgi:hypothetical protein